MNNAEIKQKYMCFDIHLNEKGDRKLELEYFRHIDMHRHTGISDQS